MNQKGFALLALTSGWAGVGGWSIGITSVIEKNLLQFPIVKKVIVNWDGKYFQ